MEWERNGREMRIATKNAEFSKEDGPREYPFRLSVNVINVVAKIIFVDPT